MASAGQRAALGLIRAYQLTFSALLGRQCRYLPTCSDYAAEAVRRHGVWPGTWMATARLCRCHPLGAWGYDPVPLRCEAVPAGKPWRHGVWRLPATTELPADEDQDRASNSAARP
jgi:putative membrane protein insertion efficiency factor